MITKGQDHGERIYIPTCDCCGAELPEEYDYNAAVRAMREAGWKSRKDPFGDWENLCPDCRPSQPDFLRPSAASDFAGLI